MSVFSENAKDKMLDALTPVHAVLHTGDPGAAGTTNRIGGDFSTAESCSFSAASGGERALAAQVDWTGLTPSQSVTWASFWTDSTGSPGDFEGKTALTGDSAANSAGEFSITTATKLKITDS